MFYYLQSYSKERRELETWIDQNSFALQQCPIGDDVMVSQLLSKYKSLLDKNTDMIKLRNGLSKALNDITQHEMCSKAASADIKSGLEQLAARQVSLFSGKSVICRVDLLWSFVFCGNSFI